MKEISLYIHIPFCKQKCFYCDFLSFAGKESLMEEYVEALIREIRERASKYIIKSIFIGGGTPSYLEVEQIENMLKEISYLKIKQNAEVTMECNPGTLTKEKLKVMKDGGINRISFGLQSCNDELLKKIGRIHDYKEFLENYNMAREIGFNNINIDLMYGLPNQNEEDWKNTLNKICTLNPEHISAYSLIIEEGTAFYKMYENNKLILPEEDIERKMDSYTEKILEQNGYIKYEISNYAKDNKECEHNKVYWSLGEYIGVGVAASTYIDGNRVVNIDGIQQYIDNMKNGISVIAETHKNSKEDEVEEYVFMGLRMKRGINIEDFNQKFGVPIESIYKEVIEKNISKDLLRISNGYMALTNKGIELSNYVMSDFILDKN